MSELHGAYSNQTEPVKLMWNENILCCRDADIWRIIARDAREEGADAEILWRHYKSESSSAVGIKQFGKRIEAIRRIGRKGRGIAPIIGMKAYWAKAGKACTLNCADAASARFFIAEIGASGHIYVQPFRDDLEKSWIKGILGACRFFGGVPDMIIPASYGGFKDYFEPMEISPCEDLSEFCGFAIMPAIRLEEVHFKVSAENLLQGFMPTGPSSFGLVKRAAGQMLKAGGDKNIMLRRRAFEKSEKPHLKKLPGVWFDIPDVSCCEAGMVSAVRCGKRFYPVASGLFASDVIVKATSREIAVYNLDNDLIALHSIKKGSETLWMRSRDDYARWAKQVGPNADAFVGRFLNASELEETALRKCLSTLQLSQQYGSENLEEACEAALRYDLSNPSDIAEILDAGVEYWIENEECRIAHIEEMERELCSSTLIDAFDDSEWPF
jgi:hypothetical protein